MIDRRRFLTGVAATGAVLLTHHAEPLLSATEDTKANGGPRLSIGAHIPWTTYPAAEMKTTGTIMGPKYGPFLVEMESTGQRCVKLSAPGEYVEFKVQSAANAMVVRYSLPDSVDGKGLNSTIEIYRNGKLLKTVPITSRYSWLYGNYPFTNDPKDGKPRNFYDDVRVKGIEFAKGDVIRLQKPANDVAYVLIDLVDLENTGQPLDRPTNSLSIMEFGAGGKGATDDTEALRKCLAEAARQGKTAWVPAGDYKLTGDIEVPSNVKLLGAGIWHTNFVGDEELYKHPDRRLRFKLTGGNSHLAHFALIGKLNYRNDDEQNDGILGSHARDCTVSHLWIEHTKVGMWSYVCQQMVIYHCRFRNTLADGVNFCVDVRNSVVQDCTARNTGDDCFAIWPAPSDQGHIQQTPLPGNNVIGHCTGQMPFLANGGAIYGGANNRIENCTFTDIASGCGILLSSTFPTSDEKLGIDNNFSGTTTVRNSELLRCGGYDHGWQWRGAFQVCLHRKSISGLRISDVRIKDSLSDGFSVVAPGAADGHANLSETRLEKVEIPNYGIGAQGRHGLWIREDAEGGLTIADSRIADVNNSSKKFRIASI